MCTNKTPHNGSEVVWRLGNVSFQNDSCVRRILELLRAFSVLTSLYPDSPSMYHFLLPCFFAFPCIDALTRRTPTFFWPSVKDTAKLIPTCILLTPFFILMLKFRSKRCACIWVITVLVLQGHGDVQCDKIFHFFENRQKLVEILGTHCLCWKNRQVIRDSLFDHWYGEKNTNPCRSLREISFELWWMILHSSLWFSSILHNPKLNKFVPAPHWYTHIRLFHVQLVMLWQAEHVLNLLSECIILT